MRAPQAVHVLVEVHHLEPIELRRHLLDLLRLARLLHLNALGIPLDVLSRRRLVLPPSFDGTAGDFAIVDIRDLVVADGASDDIGRTHICLLACYSFCSGNVATELQCGAIKQPITLPGRRPRP
jgi:hypothetical protein